jgi:hypothetical protein
MLKLTDTQRVILSSALRRNDRGVDLPANVTGEPVRKAVDNLIRAGLLEEVGANGSLLAWRRDAEAGPMALRITKQGLEAVKVKDDAVALLRRRPRLILGLGSLFVPPCRIPKLAVILKPRTLLRFHAALKKCKYRWLFSSGGHRRPGPKGPSRELIDAIVEFKRRNPRVGCPASHSSLRTPLASISTKTSSAGCSRNTIDPRQEPMARPG